MATSTQAAPDCFPPPRIADEDVVTEILTAFAQTIIEDDDAEDLENYFDQWCEANELTESDVQLLKLANPTLNVDTNNKAFEAVNSVGMAVKVHYRVMNKLTNEYVTSQTEKTYAEEIAADLNRDFAKSLPKELQESVTRKHFQQVANTVRAIEDPGKRQEFADHHASVSPSKTPRFDRSKFHAAIGDA